jgi:hypothetical protein
MQDQLILDLMTVPMADVIRQVQLSFPGIPYHMRDHLGFRPEYVEWIKRGTKRCTIRFRRDEVDIPSANVLPIRETKPEDPSWRVDLGDVYIKTLAIKRFGLLTNEDSIWDGFRRPQELKRALERVYGKIHDQQFVSLYWFEIKSWATSLF